MKNKKMFNIPVDFKMFGDVQVEAESLEEAIEIVLNDLRLPEHKYYLKESLKVDSEMVEEYKEEDNLTN